MSQQAESATASDDQYTVRLFEPGDREGYLKLHDATPAYAGGTDEWFRWKFEENPYVDHVPIVAAVTDDGQFVGAKGSFVLPIRNGEETCYSFQMADTMVHPDHRRKGLYSRMTELMKEVYGRREDSISYGFPNEKSLAGSRKHGWRVAKSLETYLRIQRPSALVGEESSAPVRLAGRFGTPFVRGYLKLRDAAASSSDISVERHDGIPAETFAALYRRNVPDELHARRDEQFYRWRFDNPHWEYTAYTAHTAGRDGSPEAGLVVGRNALSNGQNETVVTDAVPLAAEGRTEAFSALLDRVKADFADADFLAATADTLPASLLGRHGFLSDGAFPLSRLTEWTYLITYPLSEGPESAWETDARDLDAADRWHIGYAEQDTN